MINPVSISIASSSDNVIKYILYNYSCIIYILQIGRRQHMSENNDVQDEPASQQLSEEGEPIHHHYHHHRHHQRHRAMVVFWWLLGILLFLTVFFAGVAWHNLSVTTGNMYNSAGIMKQRDADKVLAEKRPVSILLLGTDTGALGRDYKGRTDTMMVMTINPRKQTTTIVSVPRDMEVNLPGYADESPAKINSAYTYGGIKESVKVVRHYFKIPIDYYVMVNMGGLEKAIDQVGGVDVTSPLTFSYDGASFNKGQNYHLNGANALKFSRMRHEDPQGDYGRQQRQQLIVRALLKKSASYKSVMNREFLKSISDSSQTDLTFKNMVTLVRNYRHASGHVVRDHAQGHSENIDGESYEVVSDTERNRVSTLLQNSLKN